MERASLSDRSPSNPLPQSSENPEEEEPQTFQEPEGMENTK